MAGINLAAFRKAMDDKGSQTLKGNGAAPPTPTRDKPTVTPSKKQLSDARQKAISNLGAKGAANSSGRLALRNANAAERASMGSHPHKGDDTKTYLLPNQSLLETDKKTTRPRGRMTMN